MYKCINGLSNYHKMAHQEKNPSHQIVFMNKYFFTRPLPIKLKSSIKKKFNFNNFVS